MTLVALIAALAHLETAALDEADGIGLVALGWLVRHRETLRRKWNP